MYKVDSTLVHSKKSLLIVKLGSFQNASIEIKQISFVYQQNRFTVIVVLMIIDSILAFVNDELVYILIFILDRLYHTICFLLSSKLFFFIRGRISFQDQRKYFDRKRLAFETIIFQLLKAFLSCQF